MFVNILGLIIFLSCFGSYCILYNKISSNEKLIKKYLETQEQQHLEIVNKLDKYIELKKDSISRSISDYEQARQNY